GQRHRVGPEHRRVLVGPHPGLLSLDSRSSVEMSTIKVEGPVSQCADSHLHLVSFWRLLRDL
ncbi:hypothetical protein ACFVRU_34235, partial [Streptomyces sp. NPDC057927]